MKQGGKAIGVDGYPMGAPAPDETGDAWWARVIRDRLHACGKAWLAGNPLAIADATVYCGKSNTPPPPWLVAAVKTLVACQMHVQIGRGRFNSGQAIFAENQKHHLRWEMVRELSERGHELYERFEDDRGLTMEKTYAAVAEKLEGTPFEGGEDAIRYSFELVEKRLAQGRGAEFYISRFKC